MTEIHVLLTHTFHIANDNGFQFFGYPIGCRRTDGSVWVVMYLVYPPTCSILEDHLNVTPSLDLDVQLVTHLMLMMEKSCPERIIQHYCCIFSGDLSIQDLMLHYAFEVFFLQDCECL